jgi:hypothetical protein
MSVLITAEELRARRSAIATSPDLTALDRHLAADITQVLAHPLYVPEKKALLSRWGAHCRDDEAELAFDPFTPHEHRCTRCGRVWNTEQTHRWWVYWYQLWLAERVLVMTLQSGGGGSSAAGTRALDTLAAIVERYQTWPNADNVLGPSRPFFSTYLESIWILQLAGAASALEGEGRLPRALADDLRQRLFAPSAAIIADFDEGPSNRQVWNSAALFALGRILGDNAMAKAAAHGPSGILASLDHGLLADGLWYEGENYHWFALRGIAWGAELLRTAGDVNLWTDGDESGAKFRAAFRAPVLTALPDFTFPARRDSKFGVSLRQRRMAEMWELALARQDGKTAGRQDGTFFASLLGHVYRDEGNEGKEGKEGWQQITDVERNEPARVVRRTELGWKGWLWMAPELRPAEPDAWRPGTTHLEATGLAVFRREAGRTYVSVDYGEPGGGHGHPDRLNLTAVLNDVPWLLDFGTGSYLAPSLAWYRATLAHNAPLVDGVAQAPARGQCVAFDERGEFGWVCASLPPDTAFDAAALQRTVVVTPQYVLDIVQLRSETGDRQLALPWHGLGRVQADEHGLVFTRPEGTLRIHLSARQPFQVLVQRGPGPPSLTGSAAEEMDYAVALTSGEAVTLVACLDPTGVVTEIECVEDDFLVRLADGSVHVHRGTDLGWLIESDRGDPVELEGLRDLPEQAPLAHEEPTPPFSLAAGAPIELNRADQFRRAEEPYPGPEVFSARATLQRDDETVHVTVTVTAPEPWFRPPGSVDPEWENENPDTHSDGLQVYVEFGGFFFGWLIVPDAEDHGQLRVAAVRGTDGDVAMVTEGAWQPTPDGYRLSFDLVFPEPVTADLGFDLYVNRARDDRERRTGQLAWSGARDGRLYLAGDRAMAGALPRVKFP